MKKILIILITLLALTSCAKKESNNTNTKDEGNKYIEPAQLVNYIDYLNDETKKIMIDSNTSEDSITNNDLTRMGKPICGLKVQDINGKELNFADLENKKVIIEVVAEWCGNCQQQAKELTPDLIKALPSDVVFIQYFNVGTVDQIKEFYKNLDMPVPSNIIIIPENEELKSYFTNDLKLEYYPTFLFFNNGILTWTSWGSFSKDSYKKCEDVAFKNPISLSKLVDNNGKSIFENGKSTDDVKKELSPSNIETLKAIDEDGRESSLKTTLKVIGNKIDFNTITEVNPDLSPAIDSFKEYENENVIILFTTMDKDYIKEDYELMNNIIAANPNQKFIVLLKDAKDDVVYSGEIKGDNVKVSLAEANVPDDITNLKLERVPVAVFIEKGTVTGAIAAISSPEVIKDNLSLFFGDGSIALKKNNQ